MKTSYHLLNNTTNKYVGIIEKCIRDNGINIESFNLKLSEVKNDSKLYNLNWYESVFPRNIIKGYMEFFKKVYILNQLKKENKKIIWTIHNKEAHDYRYKTMSKYLIRKLCKDSDEIIVHCNETTEFFKNNYEEFDENKVNYIPHPNYINVYEEKNIDFRKELGILSDELVFLFIGQIRPYKNVEMIIDLAKEINNKKIKFIIAGNPNSKEYRKELLDKIGESQNVISMFRFIKDEELTSLIKAANIMVLPYDMKSSLNSGSIILSFSMGRSVIAPNIGTLKDIKEKDLYWSYDYNSEEEHFKEFKFKVNEIILNWERKSLNLIDLETKLLNLMKNEYSHEKIGRMYKNLYGKYDGSSS